MSPQRFALLMTVCVAVACSGAQKGPVPVLPGTGTENTAPPGPGTTEADPWADAELIARPAPKPPAAIALPEVKRFTLPNGLEVMVIEDHSLPVAAMSLAIKAGRRDVAREKTGLAAFAAEMLTKGTRGRSAQDIAGAIDSAGGRLSASANLEATEIDCNVLSAQLGTCVDLMSDVVVRPSFPEKEMGAVRKLLLASVNARLDNAGQLASLHLLSLLWGNAHVRGWVMSAHSVASIDRNDLVRWHRTWFHPQNAVLAVAGDVDAKSLEKTLGRAFRRWRNAKVPAHPDFEAPVHQGMTIELVDKPDQTQSHIAVGQVGIAHTDKRFYDTLVWNYVLGGGAFSSRLMEVVRVEGGKTYGASSQFDKTLEPGSFVAQTFTRTEETARTAKLVLGELAKMNASGPTAQEVQNAITHIAGAYALGFQSSGDIASALLNANLHGLDADYVRNLPLKVGEVTQASAAAAASSILAPKNLVMVIVGNAKKVAPQLRAEGWKFTEVAYTEAITGYERARRKAEQNAPVSAEAQKAGRAILKRTIAAKGGQKRIAAIKSLVLHGDAKITMGGRALDAKVTRTFVAPNKMRLDLVIGALATVHTVFDGQHAWMQREAGGQSKTVDMSANDIASAKAQIWRDPDLILSHVDDSGTTVAKVGEKAVDARKYDVVQVTSPAKTTVKLYIDKKTHLVGRVEYSEQGQKNVDVLSDYRKVKGIQFAHHRVTTGGQGKFEVKVTSIKVNSKVAPNLFTK